MMALAVSCAQPLGPDPTPTPDPGPTPGPDPVVTSCEGWPEDYGGVMLQGFYWDSFADTQWAYLEEQAGDIAPYFTLIWVPNSGYCQDGKNMGYLPLKFFDQNSTFGNEAQLRSMIKAYKSKGTGIIEDVVINHHNTSSGWFTFSEETYKGKKYQFKATDITKDDDGGNTAAEAKRQGVSISSNIDTGEEWPGCRDLDHKSKNVQEIVLAYLDYLANDLGYAGFRYDMVKGYAPAYTGYYNNSVKAKFSVGEYWDGNTAAVQKWLDGTKGEDGKIQSAAFDFPFRYTCRDAANGSWKNLTNASCATNPGYSRYSVTFVENHDTEYRSASAPQDPIKRDTLAVNAWLMANPGTPCVFYKHWQDYKKDIKLMIEARKLVGITNTSSFSNKSAATAAGYAAREIKGKNGSMIVVAGPQCSSFTAPAGFTELLKGYHYRYLVSSDCKTDSWAATVARIEKEEDPGEFTPHKATMHVCADFTPVYFYIWDKKDIQLNGEWPGLQMTQQVEKFGKKWFTQSIDIKVAGYYYNMVISQGKNMPQSEDITRISSDRYYEATLSDGKVKLTDVTKEYENK